MIIYSDLFKMGLDIFGISLLCVFFITAALYILFKLLQGFFGNKVPCVGVAVLLIIVAVITISNAGNVGVDNRENVTKIMSEWSELVLLSLIPIMGLTPLFVDGDGFFSGLWNTIKLNAIIVLGATALYDWFDWSWICYVLMVLCAAGIVLAWVRDDY